MRILLESAAAQPFWVFQQALRRTTEALRLDSPEAMARISVTLPRSLCRQFRLYALEQDTTLSALMARLIRQEIRHRP